jgi:MFS transporter, PHS family, inorganic phosphate transporter
MLPRDGSHAFYPAILTCFLRFFFDFAFYGLGLNNTSVLSAIGFSGGNNIYDNLRDNAIGNLVLVCAGSIPGYWLTVATIDTVGRRPIQIVGFFILTVIFCVIGFAYHLLSKGALLALYILAQLFFNFGPNTTTFIIPGECFPTRYRSTGHGISAASGKIGAIVAQLIATPLLSKDAPVGCTGNTCSPWLNHLMQIFALFMLCGMFVSLLLPETKGCTLEEIAGEESMSPNEPSPMIKDGWQQFNPFVGGRPSGINWGRSPNVGPRGPGLLGKRERTGIMTSPELLPKKGGDREKHSLRDSRDTSDESMGTMPTYSISVSSHGRVSGNGRRGVDTDNDDLYINGVGTGQLPGWGAGWGVQRNPVRDGRVESIQLQDVGRLLK